MSSIFPTARGDDPLREVISRDTSDPETTRELLSCGHEIYDYDRATPDRRRCSRCGWEERRKLAIVWRGWRNDTAMRDVQSYNPERKEL